jgi:hypothetical protein
MSKKRIYSLMFGLKDYIGHIYQYHLSIAKVCKLNHWDHKGLIPKNCKIKDLPKSWQKVLADTDWENKNIWQNVVSCWQNYLFLKKFLKKTSENEIIFLEHFSVFNIFSLILGILFSKPKCSFWILHRFVFSSKRIKTTLYKILNALIKKKLTLLTDSDLLAKEQTQLFKREVNVVPIPHTKGDVSTTKKINHSNITIWWPGGSVRWDKGLDYIKLLSNQITTRKGVSLVLANSAKAKIFKSENIIFLSTDLSSDEYYKQMKATDLILLPYIPREYKLRTSGIFVEAITCGTKVITFKGTWMSYELEKYGLNNLAINPEEFSIDKILEIYQLDLADKFQNMVIEYTKFHSEKNLASVLVRYF